MCLRVNESLFINVGEMLILVRYKIKIINKLVIILDLVENKLNN